MAHFLATTSLQKFVPLGRLGVILFFVLSGFLITKILIDTRTQIETISHTNRWRTLGCFYARRSLRIFPIYYLLIIALSIIDHDMRKDVLWYITFTQNIPPGFGEGTVFYAGHLWSLAVEEQFYLVWPWLVLFVPRRVLIWVLWCLVLAAICYKFIGLQSGMNLQALIYPVIGNTDSLAVGGLLALYRSRETHSVALQRLLILGGVALFPLCGLQCARYWLGSAAMNSMSIYVGFNDICASLAFVPLVHFAATHTPRGPIKYLALAPIRYIGKISYGMYLYHIFIAHGISLFSAKYGLQLPSPGLPQFALFSSITFIVSMVSWELFERPVNALKNAFPYVPKG